jgi:uncharacterized protein YcnI
MRAVAAKKATVKLPVKKVVERNGVTFVNVRETAGWTLDARKCKIAHSMKKIGNFA